MKELKTNIDCTSKSKGELIILVGEGNRKIEIDLPEYGEINFKIVNDKVKKYDLKESKLL
ncbi:hypothetical protein ACQCVP_11925 [Rossellomorea vietnamensis]|uniref:hypothetical protein n=1 Tax=Rossellomorea vietnamensis TaxID=218284 RepID=UPI003CFA0C4C